MCERPCLLELYNLLYKQETGATTAHQRPDMHLEFQPGYFIVLCSVLSFQGIYQFKIMHDEKMHSSFALKNMRNNIQGSRKFESSYYLYSIIYTFYIFVEVCKIFQKDTLTHTIYIYLSTQSFLLEKNIIKMQIESTRQQSYKL